MAFITEPQGLRAPGRQRVEEDSPLQQIEQSVQQRAASLALDMAAPDSAATLQRLVEAEIDQWNLDHRRGLRPYELVEPALVAERAMRNLTGYGPLQGLLADGDVWEIMINAPDGAFSLKPHTRPTARKTRSAPQRYQPYCYVGE